MFLTLASVARSRWIAAISLGAACRVVFVAGGCTCVESSFDLGALDRPARARSFAIHGRSNLRASAFRDKIAGLSRSRFQQSRPIHRTSQSEWQASLQQNQASFQYRRVGVGVYPSLNEVESCSYASLGLLKVDKLVFDWRLEPVEMVTVNKTSKAQIPDLALRS